MFWWQVQGKTHVLVVQTRLFEAGAGDWRGLMSMYRFRGRRSTLDMMVIFGVL